MVLKRLLQRFGEHRHAIFRAFAVANRDFIAGEVDILNPQAQNIP